MPDAATVNLGIRMDESEALSSINRISEQLKGLSKTASSQLATVGGAWDTLKFRNKVGIGSGVALGAVDAAVSLFGDQIGDKTANALKGAAQGAGKFAAMLAPLGPVAAGVGAAVGGLSGAVQSLAESSRKAKEALEKEAALREKSERGVTTRTAELDYAWSVANEDERAKMQHEARERFKKYNFMLDRGASVSEADVLDALSWSRGKTSRRMLQAYEAQNGGLTDALKPYAAQFAAAEQDRASKAYWKLAEELEPQIEDLCRRADTESSKTKRSLYASMADEKQSQLDAALDAMLKREDEQRSKYGDWSEAGLNWQSSFGGKSSRFDRALDARWEEMQKPVEKEAKTAAEKLAPGRMAHERGAQADSWSAQGIGYTGNPMQTTETLLREIGAKLAEMRDIARRTARTPLPAVAI